jgi:cytochrome P450
MNIDQALTDPGFFVDNDPHPIWRQLRREDPIHWTQGRVSPFWSITRYDDIIAVFSEPNLFTSTRGLIIPSSPEMEQLTPEMQGADQMMIMTDPPLHTAMRRAFNRLFLPRPVGKYETPGHQLVAEIPRSRDDARPVRFRRRRGRSTADGFHLRNHGDSAPSLARRVQVGISRSAKASISVPARIWRGSNCD